MLHAVEQTGRVADGRRGSPRPNEAPDGVDLCVETLLVDYRIRDARLSVDDLIRVVSLYGLPADDLEDVWRQIDAEGISLERPDAHRRGARPSRPFVLSHAPTQAFVEAFYERRPDPDEVGRLLLRRQLATRIESAGRSAGEARPRIAYLLELGLNARNRLIRGFLRLVVGRARLYAGRSRIGFADLVQEGVLGLDRAIAMADPDRSDGFQAYAGMHVWSHIHRVIATRSGAIRMPVFRSAEIKRMRRERVRLAVELGREPSMDELARALGKTRRVVEAIVATPEQPASLDELLEEGREQEALPGEDLDGIMGCAELHETLVNLIAGLDKREQLVLRMRFGIGGETPRTLEQIAQLFCVTRERVRQIEHRAIERLASPARARPLQAFLG